ncbi:MAG TPA: helix-turn-helix transcriptional regulator [Candidatus Binatia bacterium]|jgi:putative transcriptional regulator|nr:helix-turn-helix transcriptional regulator [Candidatus Binatia bacterium]
MIRFRLHKVAADRDITKIKDVAGKAGLSALAVSGIWNNISLRVDLSTLNALCEALHCTPGDLLEYVPEVSPKSKKKG